MTAARAHLDAAPRATRRDVAVLVASVALHVLGAVGVGRVRASHETPPAPTEVRLEIATPPRPPEAAPPPPPAPAPAPAHPRRVARATTKAPAAPVPAPTPTLEPPPVEEPVDLTGVTLTDPGAGAAWASAAGNGASRSGPVGPIARTPRAAAAPRAQPGDGDNGVVPLGDLRQPPQPPALEDALERQYPSDARRDGTPGRAQVRALVRPDGNLDRIRVVVASAPMFGDACRRVLAGSRWTPPLDREGSPCATEISYVCRFEVSR